jgi:hypothetical protein
VRINSQERSPARVDLGDRERQVAIECESFAFHGDRASFAARLPALPGTDRAWLVGAAGHLGGRDVPAGVGGFRDIGHRQAAHPSRQEATNDCATRRFSPNERRMTRCAVQRGGMRLNRRDAK